MSAPLTPDPERLAEFWDRTIQPGDVHEVRIVDTRYGGPCRLLSGKTYSGYFNDKDAVVRELSRYTGADAAGVYITVNPVIPDLLARRANRIDIAETGKATGDAQIPRLTRLPIDCDPVRVAYIGATDAERDAALARRDAIRAHLRDEGWPDPAVVAESGNGGHLLYAVDLANTPENVDRLKRVLSALDSLFSDDVVHVDTTTHNPSRVLKVPGTISAKGDNVPARPHRLATASYGPAVPVTVEQLEQLAVPAEAPEAAQPKPGLSKYAVTVGGERAWKIADVLQDAGIVSRVKKLQYATVYQLDRCLTSADHTDGAAILEFPSGALDYTCLHDRCSGKGWHDVKHLLPIPKPQQSEPKDASKPAGKSEPVATALELVSLANVPAREIEWLWPGWVPRRMLTVLGGFAGDGKSTLAAYLIAKLTRGGLMPDGTRAPSIDCLMLAAEDDASYALVPRLQLHGADLSRVHLVKGTKRDDGSTGWFNLQRDMPLMRDAIRERNIGFVAIDPLSSYMPKADRNNEGDVRDALMPVQQLMDETGVAVLGIMHIGKGDAQRRAWQRLLGSSAFTALARSVVMLTELPDEYQEDGDTRKAVGVVKSNYAIPPSALMFSRPLDGAIQFHGLSPLTIEEAFSYKPKDAKKDEAADWLSEYLKDGRKLSSEAESAAKAAGFTRRTYWWARKALEVSAFKDGPDWYIELPAKPLDVSAETPEPSEPAPQPTMSTVSLYRKSETVEAEDIPTVPTISTVSTIPTTPEPPEIEQPDQSTVPLSLYGGMVDMVDSVADPSELFPEPSGTNGHAEPDDPTARYLARRTAELAAEPGLDRHSA